MNKVLVFRNPKVYDLFLPTPNGAGRRLPVGKCVAGSFYLKLAATGHLVQADPNTVADADILWEAELSGYQYPKPVVAEPVVETPVVVSEVVVPIIEAPVVEPVSESISAEDRELTKLGMEELKMIAATKGIDFPSDIKKRKLIALIRTR